MSLKEKIPCPECGKKKTRIGMSTHRYTVHGTPVDERFYGDDSMLTEIYRDMGIDDDDIQYCIDNDVGCK